MGTYDPVVSSPLKLAPMSPAAGPRMKARTNTLWSRFMYNRYLRKTKYALMPTPNRPTEGDKASG